MANVSEINSNNKTDQTEDDSNCMTIDSLASVLNIDKFNQMITNTSSTVNSFLTSYIKSQTEQTPTLQVEMDRYRQTALDEQRKMIEKHEKMMIELNNIFGLYETQLQSAKNTEDLYKMLHAQNIKLKKIVESEIHTIEISDRKTYYENEQNGYAGWWASLFSKNYKYLILLLILFVILKKRYNEPKLWGTIIALALYPILAYYVIDFIIGIYDWIMSKTKWVYLHL
jgi:DNA polymerase II small subunit/DNA polymerase delta subunit B